MSDMSILQQMNSLMEEKEAVFQKREEQLQLHHKRLKEFESQLIKKAKELQEKQKELEQKEQELQNKQKELTAYEKNIEDSMELVLSEKMKLENKNKEQLESILKKEEALLMEEWEHSELEQLGVSLGIEMPMKLEHSKLESTENEGLEELESSQTYGEEIPELFQKMENVVKKKYTKWSIIEILPERFCVQIGDKELRVFERKPLSMAQIVMYKRNAKTDKRIQAKTVAICRIEPEWSIVCEENSIVCSISFQKETEVELILEKCSQFMKNHLKI